MTNTENISLMEYIADIRFNKLGHQWFRKWHDFCSTPSHYLKHCRIVLNWTIWEQTAIKLRCLIKIKIPQFSYREVHFSNSYIFFKMVTIYLGLNVLINVTITKVVVISLCSHICAPNLTTKLDVFFNVCIAIKDSELCLLDQAPYEISHNIAVIIILGW